QAVEDIESDEGAVETYREARGFGRRTELKTQVGSTGARSGTELEKEIETKIDCRSNTDFAVDEIAVLLLAIPAGNVVWQNLVFVGNSERVESGDFLANRGLTRNRQASRQCAEYCECVWNGPEFPHEHPPFLG